MAKKTIPILDELNAAQSALLDVLARAVDALREKDEEIETLQEVLADYKSGETAQDLAEAVRQLRTCDVEIARLRAALADIRTGAEQRSQSHADVIAKCKGALG